MKRIDYIDNAKGLLILLMVIAHIFQKGYLHDIIYTFHMPAFFIINGLLFNYSSSIKKSLFDFTKSRMYNLLVPFCFFEILGMFVQMFVYGILLNPIGYIYGLVTLTYYNDPCWFLVATFGANILFFLLQKLNNKFCIWLMTIVICMCSYFSTSILSDFRRMGIALAFMTFGYYAADYLKTNNRIFFILALLATIIIAFVNGDTSFVAFDFGNPIFYLIGAVSGTYVILCVAKKINFRPLKYWGENSLVIMATHWLIIMIVHKYVGTTNLSYTNGTITLILVIMSEFLIIYIFNKCIPFLIGKKINNIK